MFLPLSIFNMSPKQKNILCNDKTVTFQKDLYSSLKSFPVVQK